MKKLLIIFVIGLLAACSTKQNDPAPDAGNVVAGVYPLTYVRSDSAGVKLYEYTLPFMVGTTTLSGLLTARRDSASTVFLTQTIKVTGRTDQTSVLGEISLRSNGSGYDLYLSNQKIGTADGTTLTIDDQQTDSATGTVYRDQLMGKKTP